MTGLLLVALVGAITIALQALKVIDILADLTDLWIWIAAILLGIACGLLTRGIKLTDKGLVREKIQMTEKDTEQPLAIKQPQQPKPRYIPDSYISGQIIHLMDLLAPGAKPIISNRTIEDCEIRGPAMIALLGGVTIADSGFDGDIDSLFVEIVAKRMIFGAIGLQNCTFRRCRFIAIGIIGTKEQIEQAKKGFAPLTSHKEGSQP